MIVLAVLARYVANALDDGGGSGMMGSMACPASCFLTSFAAVSGRDGGRNYHAAPQSNEMRFC